MNHIVIIGFMGSGKTRVGKRLAKDFNLPFVDVDRVVSKKMNLTMKEIFDRFGELAGIEPASESLFIKASPITVAVLTFPRMYAHRQAYNLSSFIIHLPGQSLPGKVSHIVDARFLKCECIRADEQQLGC